MAGERAPGEERVRAAEVIASLCLTTNLGMGFPFEHGLHATLTTMRLCDALDVDAETAAQAYYASLLMYTGCTTDADVASRIFRGSLTESGTHRQFGQRLDILGGIVGAIPAPDSPLPRRAYDIATRLPKAAIFAKTHFTALCEVAEMLARQVGLPMTCLHCSGC